MIGQYNQFTHNNYLPNQQIGFVFDTTPICQIQNNLVTSEKLGDQETRIYNLQNQNKDRITQSTNLVDKISRLIKDVDNEEDDEQKSAEVPTRYFNVDSIDVLSKGVCRRCKKPGHYEKWCTEEIDEPKQVCRFCLGDHYYLKCSNNLCFKCNQIGHMAKDCEDNGTKCHRCNKRGHKQRDCFVIDLKDDNIFELDKQRLKDIICLNCRKRGHLNCYNQEYCKYDYLYCSKTQFKERQKKNAKKNEKKNEYNYKKENQIPKIPQKIKQQSKQIQKHKYFEQLSPQSQYSIWSDESPNTKRMAKNRKRKNNKKKQQKQYY